MLWRNHNERETPAYHETSQTGKPPENVKQTIWIYQYGRRYWKSMILYTLLGVMGSCVSLASSLISKDLVDIITGHQTGRLLSTLQQ